MSSRIHVLVRVGIVLAFAVVGAVAAREVATRDRPVWTRIATPAPSALPTPAPAPTTEPPPMPDLVAPTDPQSVMVDGAQFLGWAFLDRSQGTIVGSPNAAAGTNTVESMIKPWVAADYLRRLSESGGMPTPQALQELARMIVDSNDSLTEKYYRLGGTDAVSRRLMSVCGLTSLDVEPTRWSQTKMTPEDAARFGACLADGRAAGPQWTPWILDTMRVVRGALGDPAPGGGGGRWGIIDVLPPELSEKTSIKNGWTLYKDGWHVNCLAVHPEWVLIVMIRTNGGLELAAKGCAAVAELFLAKSPS